MSDFQIEQCTLKDLQSLQTIAVQTFRATYEHLNKPENFIPYLQKAFSDTRLTEELSNTESTFFFVKFKNTIIGFLKLNVGTAQTEVKSRAYLEIERIYVLKTQQGQGVGRVMIEYVEQFAKAQGKSKIWLGVWSKNEKAIGFYERMGFVKNGTHIFQIGDDAQLDFIMEKGV